MLDTIYEYDPTKERIKIINKAIVILSMFMLAIIPLLMYRHDAIMYTPILAGNGYASGAKVDVFNYYKAVAFNVFTLLVLGLFIYKTIVLGEEIKSTKLNLIILMVGAIIVISPLLSKYTDIALFGNSDRHEGAYTWFSYLAIFFIIYNTKIEKELQKYFYWALVPFIVVNLTFGLLNTYGYNLLENETFNNFLGGGLGGYIVTTLYNPNFGSAISAVIYSASLVYLLLEKNIKLKVILLITTVASFVMLLTMFSSGGFITILVTIPIILVMGLRLTNIKNTALWSGLSFIISGVIYNLLSKVDPRIYGESFELLSKINGVSPIILPAAALAFVGLVVLMKFVNKKLAFNIIAGMIIVGMFGTGIGASIIIEKEKEALANNQNITKLEDNSIYQTLDAMSSTRLDIWMKTIDLINEKPLIGHGFDTYPYVMAELDEEHGITSAGQFADKPHSWYLNIAYGSGVIALLGVLSIIVYIAKGVFDNLSDKIQNKHLYIVGIAAIAYAITGMLNDSFIGTAIYFWIMAGACASLLTQE